VTSNFVLVHGAWHGGWCYSRVRDRLARLGHRVFTPTLTGLGERSHLLCDRITLDTHITDVVNMILWEDLNDVVLVGHSYGGRVISGAAEQILPRLASIVFIDSPLPNNGDAKTVADSALVDLNKMQSSGASAYPPPPVEDFAIMSPEDRSWVESKLTPQPVGPWLQPIRLSGARDRVPKKSYVRGLNCIINKTVIKVIAERSDWKTFDLACGHDVMIDLPDELTEILVSTALTDVCIRRWIFRFRNMCSLFRSSFSVDTIS
jgi:Alpha/beta hydrolase family